MQTYKDEALTQQRATNSRQTINHIADTYLLKN